MENERGKQKDLPSHDKGVLGSSGDSCHMDRMGHNGKDSLGRPGTSLSDFNSNYKSGYNLVVSGYTHNPNIFVTRSG